MYDNLPKRKRARKWKENEVWDGKGSILRSIEPEPGLLIEPEVKNSCLGLKRNKCPF